MPPPKRKVKQQPPKAVQMFYIGCAMSKPGRTGGGKSLKGNYYRDKDNKFVSSELSQHLLHSNFHGCLKHYKDAGLCSVDEENQDNYLSLVGSLPIEHPPKCQNKSYTPDQIGLNLTANGPSSIQLQKSPV